MPDTTGIECKKEISDKASSCPNCGCPIAFVQTITPLPTVPSVPKASKKTNTLKNIRVVILFSFLLVLVYLFLVRTVGKDSADKAVATITRTPIELHNSTENVPASSWKAIGLTLPYNGQLQLDVNVLSGNPQQVLLMKVSELPNYKADVQFQHYTDFDAEKTMTFSRRGNLAAGQYYIVLRDNTLGIISSSTSDVKIFAKLTP